MKNMKSIYTQKVIIAFMSIFMLILSLASCSKKQENLEESGEQKLLVVTSIVPASDFVKKIGGDKIEVSSIVSPGMDSHDFEAKTSDIQKISEADIVFVSGLGMEEWINPMLEANNTEAVDLSRDIRTLYSAHTHEEHAREEHDEHDDEQHDEEEHGEHKGDTEKQIDPHVWLDPANVALQMNVAFEKLCEVDPENSEYFKKNLDEQLTKLADLTNEYSVVLSKYEDKTIVVAHAAYGYLCIAFDIKQIAIEGISGGSDPSPARMNEIINEIKKTNASTVFYEPLSSSKIASTIAAETGIVIDELDPYETVSQEGVISGEDYFSVMNRNLIALEKSFEAKK